MIKFKHNLTFKLETSSKDRSSNLMSEDEHFFSKINDKIQLTSFNQFKETVVQDIEFLNQNKRKKVSFLMLYYEICPNNINSGQNAMNFSIDSKVKIEFRVSTFSKNDLSMIPQDTKKEAFVDSSVKEIENCDEISKYGYEAFYRNFKSYNYFMFENVFQEKSFLGNEKFFEGFKEFILRKFDEISI